MMIETSNESAPAPCFLLLAVCGDLVVYQGFIDELSHIFFSYREDWLILKFVHV